MKETTSENSQRVDRQREDQQHRRRDQQPLEAAVRPFARTPTAAAARRGLQHADVIGLRHPSIRQWPSVRRSRIAVRPGSSQAEAGARRLPRRQSVELDRQAELLDRVVGGRAGQLQELGVVGLLRVHAEPVGGVVPLRRGGLERRHRVGAGPDRGRHAVEAQEVVLRAGDDRVEQADVGRVVEVDQVRLRVRPELGVEVRLEVRQPVRIAQRVGQHARARATPAARSIHCMNR